MTAMTRSQAWAATMSSWAATAMIAGSTLCAKLVRTGALGEVKNLGPDAGDLGQPALHFGDDGVTAKVF